MDIGRLEETCKMSSDKILDLGLDGVSFTNDGVLYYVTSGSPVLGVAYIGADDEEEAFFSWNEKTGQVWGSSLQRRMGLHILTQELPSVGIAPDILIVGDNSDGVPNTDGYFGAQEYKWMFSFDLQRSGASMYQYHDDSLVAKLLKYGFVYRKDEEYAAIDDLWFLGFVGFNFGNGIIGEGKFSPGLLRITERQVKRFVGFYRAMHDVALAFDVSAGFDEQAWSEHYGPSDPYDFTKVSDDLDSCDLCGGLFPIGELAQLRNIGDGVWLCEACVKTNRFDELL